MSGCCTRHDQARRQGDHGMHTKIFRSILTDLHRATYKTLFDARFKPIAFWNTSLHPRVFHPSNRRACLDGIYYARIECSPTFKVLPRLKSIRGYTVISKIEGCSTSTLLSIDWIINDWDDYFSKIQTRTSCVCIGLVNYSDTKSYRFRKQITTAFCLSEENLNQHLGR